MIPINEVLYEMSYANVLMYSAVIPRYESKQDKEEKKQDVIKADDPNNNGKVIQFLESIKD